MRRVPQVFDAVEDSGEHGARQRCFGQLEDGIAGVAHQPGAGLHQPLAQRCQRPGVDAVRGRQRAQEVRQIVGERVEMQPDGVCGEAHAG